MKENKHLEFAGDLLVEMQEVQKINCSDNVVDRGRTYTLQCTAFLTIFCC